MGIKLVFHFSTIFFTDITASDKYREKQKSLDTTGNMLVYLS
jgi:hypothetical protein